MGKEALLSWSLLGNWLLDSEGSSQGKSCEMHLHTVYLCGEKKGEAFIHVSSLPSIKGSPIFHNVHI